MKNSIKLSKKNEKTYLKATELKRGYF